jgi:hypothetical protein
MPSSGLAEVSNSASAMPTLRVGENVPLVTCRSRCRPRHLHVRPRNAAVGGDQAPQRAGGPSAFPGQRVLLRRACSSPAQPAPACTGVISKEDPDHAAGTPSPCARCPRAPEPGAAPWPRTARPTLRVRGRRRAVTCSPYPVWHGELAPFNVAGSAHVLVFGRKAKRQAVAPRDPLRPAPRVAVLAGDGQPRGRGLQPAHHLGGVGGVGIRKTWSSPYRYAMMSSTTRRSRHHSRACTAPCPAIRPRSLVRQALTNSCSRSGAGPAEWGHRKTPGLAHRGVSRSTPPRTQRYVPAAEGGEWAPARRAARSAVRSTRSCHATYRGRCGWLASAEHTARRQ